MFRNSAYVYVDELCITLAAASLCAGCFLLLRILCCHGLNFSLIATADTAPLDPCKTRNTSSLADSMEPLYDFEGLLYSPASMCLYRGNQMHCLNLNLKLFRDSLSAILRISLGIQLTAARVSHQAKTGNTVKL